RRRAEPRLAARATRRRAPGGPGTDRARRAVAAAGRGARPRARRARRATYGRRRSARRSAAHAARRADDQRGARLRARAGDDGAPNLAWLLEQPGVVRLEDPEPIEPAAPWPLLAEALGRALDELVARRTAEGDRLAEALRTLHGELTTNVELVSVRAPATTARREDRLRDRLRALLAETAIDQSRIVTEAAVWADKSDVTEELARLRAHLAEFTLMLGNDGPVGRPLDFLIQE